MLDGTGYGQYDFRVQMEFEPESSDAGNFPVTEVRDAYFSMNDLPGPFRRRGSAISSYRSASSR